MTDVVREKIRILKQLCVKVGAREIEHMQTCKNEIQLDNYAHKLIVDTIKY